MAGVHVNGLHDVAREEKLDHPVYQHAQLALRARQFGDVDAAPQKPREETGEVKPFDLGARRVVSDDAELAERVEVERPRGSTMNDGVNVAR